MNAAFLLALLAAPPAPAAFQPPTRPYDVAHYRLEVRLQEDGTFENEVAIRLTPQRALSALELDSFGLNVTGVHLADGGEVAYTLAENAAARTGLLTLRPKTPLAAGKEVTVLVKYRGQAGTAQEGFFQVERSEQGGPARYFFTHLQPSSARRFFPSNDVPSDKATSEVFAIVEAKNQVISNGKLLKDETFSEGGKHLRRVHWMQDVPHSTYLLALAVGPFEKVEVPASVPAALHVPAGTRERTFFARTATTRALSHQASLLGVKYPWARYDQVAVPHFFWGGMENTSASFVREDKLLLDGGTQDFINRPRQYGLIAHELAHQWFGDLVTCKWWDDTWLNEGFATWMTWQSVDDYFENDMAEVSRAERTFVDYLSEEDGPRAHPLVSRTAPSPSEVFDSTSYTKGAMVLRMMEEWLGREELRKGLKAYLEQYAQKNASSEDFFAAVGKATDKEKELKGFKDSWLTRKGYPVVTPDIDYDGQTLTVTLTQRPNHRDEKGAFVFKLPVVLHRDDSPSYHKEVVVTVDKPVVKVKVDVPAAPQWVNWNRDGAALVRIHTPAISEEMWTRAARHDPDPVWRVLSSYALLGDMVSPEAAEQTRPSDAATNALLDVLTKDSSPYVRAAVLERMTQAKWKRLPGDFGPAVLALAKNPENLEEDAIGLVHLKSAALAALGKLDHAEGHAYLLANVGKSNLDVNTLSGWMRGTAFIGSSEALASLRSAVLGQKRRGYPFFRASADSLGSFASPDVVAVIKEVLAGEVGNAELASSITSRLRTNREVLNSPQLAAYVADFVAQPGWSDDVKGRMVRLLDTVRTPEARTALERIASSEAGDRLTGSARQVLQANFPATATPAKGTKGKGK